MTAHKKQPYAWEEMMTETEAAHNTTIIAAWSKISAAQVTFAGHEAVERHTGLLAHAYSQICAY